jgi:outer membrane lipoprotein SlyB
MNASLVAVLLLALLVAGCATPSLSGGTYARHEARQLMHALEGEVVMVNPVAVEGTDSGIGTAGGAGIGYAAGRSVGHGWGSRVAGAAGAVGGAVAGQAIERQVTAEQGLEITVRLDNGDVIAVVQGADIVFRPGERVRVLSGGGSTRVLRLHGG